jgi:Ca2+-binding EF-hand superfamily protein
MRKTAVVLFIVLGLFVIVDAPLAQEENGGSTVEMSFDRVDEDGDGQISWEEFSRASEETDMEKMMRDFQRLDQDSSGTISREQWEEGVNG